jgi:hypothetical protein
MLSRITLGDALARVRSEPVPYALLFERGPVALEFFVPRGPHAQVGTREQDVLYLIISGAGILNRGGDRIPCSAGDVVYVPANSEHGFEAVREDFRTWALFLGPLTDPQR